MPDPETRRLDAEILRFIEKHRVSPAPEAAFDALARRLFEYQFRRNRHYRRLCELERKSPGSVRRWKDIPAMPTLGFKELVLTTFPPRKHLRVFHTSGTTGASAAKASADAPRGVHLFDTLRLYEASLLAAFECSPLKPDASFSYYFLMPSAKEAPHSSLSYMMDAVNRRFARGRGRFYVKNGVPQYARLSADLRKEKKKVLLCATAFALKGFLDFLSEKKIRLRLKPGSRLMETGGFKGRVREISKKALYTECASRLGIPGPRCVSEYGMTELSSQMYAVSGGDFRGPAWLRTMVVDPGTGKEAPRGRTGLLKHVDLANRGSVLAVQTEDLGRAVKNGFRLLGRAKGSVPRGCSLNYEEYIREGA